MRRDETPRSDHSGKHRSEGGSEIIEDASGENWDNDALNAIESITYSSSSDTPLTHEPLFPKPNLSHADLHGSDLRSADLSGTVLTKANLSEARLDHARLDDADLRGADLRSANLSEAHLNDTKLYGAFFNKKTLLPFDKGEAIRRGMVFFDIEPD